MQMQHPSDRDLVLALDGELPVRRQTAVHAHLAGCATCRNRHDEFRRIADLAGPHASRTPGAERLHDSRERLRAKLTGIAQRQDRSLRETIKASVLRIPRWAAMAAAAAAMVVLVHVVQQSGSRFLRSHATSTTDDALPVAALTPGAAWNLPVDELCAADDREQQPVGDAVRHEVVRRYGMEHVPSDEYELDYLITPELGGAPAVENLWPQRYALRTWNAHVKDQLEQLLPTLVCNGTLSLQTAQRDIARDWISAYKKYFHTDVPLQAHADLAASRTAPASDLVYPVWRSGHVPVVRLTAFSSAR
jgi:anti-sigma factor RsiW